MRPLPAVRSRRRRRRRCLFPAGSFDPRVETTRRGPRQVTVPAGFVGGIGAAMARLRAHRSSLSPMNELDSFTIMRNLEMLLDQLHFWAQRAQESRRDAGDAGVAGRMLEAATANLEAFVTILLDCFRPLVLVPIRMVVSDLVSAIAMRARGD